MFIVQMDIVHFRKTSGQFITVEGEMVCSGDFGDPLTIEWFTLEGEMETIPEAVVAGGEPLTHC